MVRLVSVPFIFNYRKYYVLIRFSNAADYATLRHILLHNGLQQLTEDNNIIMFDQGYLMVDYSLVCQDPTAIKWLLLATLDEYFRTQKALKLFGGSSLASAS